MFIRLWILDLLDNDYPTALLFSQLLWWHQPWESGRVKLHHERDGYLWLLRSDDEWTDARLSVKQVRRARLVLAARGLIEHKKFHRAGAPTSAWRPLFPAVREAEESILSTYPGGAVEAGGPTALSGEVETNPRGSVESAPGGAVPIPLLEGSLEEENPSVVAAPADAVSDDWSVFQAWREAVNKPRAIFDNDRRVLVKRRLREHPLDELLDAVRGWKHDPFYCGSNDRGVAYNDLAFLLKNAARIEKFSGMERGIGRPAVTNGPRPNHRQLDTNRDGPSGRILQP